jgi:hypothetical protein
VVLAGIGEHIRAFCVQYPPSACQSDAHAPPAQAVAVSPRDNVPFDILTVVSLTPHPHAPAAVLLGSLGQPSLQSAVPSLSVSVSATPQPQMPGRYLSESEVHLSWITQVPFGVAATRLLSPSLLALVLVAPEAVTTEPNGVLPL